MKDTLWDPGYNAELLRREEVLKKCLLTPDNAYAYYSQDCHAFIRDFGWTYDPRNAPTDLPTTMPFMLFPRQTELVTFILQLLEAQVGGQVVKSRDMGATWVAVNVAVWLWLFRQGSAVGFGSRKEMLVDKLGDRSSIFEKIRMVIRLLPGFMTPVGFSEKHHLGSMNIINPANEASIIGEAGDNIGRGARMTMHILDEAAHIERPESVDAALDDTTNCTLGVSSVNGTGNVFHRKHMAGIDWEGKIVDPTKTQIFIMDWSDHPAKDQAWYDRRRQIAEDKGLLALFAQEIERNYSASILGTLIPRSHVEAAVGLSRDFDLDVSGKLLAGLDVADDTKHGDKSAIAFISGLEIIGAHYWGQVNTSVTTETAYSYCLEKGCMAMQYDSIGVGAGVRGALGTMRQDKKISTNFEDTAWQGSAKVQNPEYYLYPSQHEMDGNTGDPGPINGDFFANRKAQAWWDVKERFFESWKCREGLSYDKDRIISINPDIDNKTLIMMKDELSQPVRKSTAAGKVLIDKSPNGAKSPNIADAIVIAMYPVIPDTVTIQDLHI